MRSVLLLETYRLISAGPRAVSNSDICCPYASVSEVVRDGLRLLREKDLILEARLQALRGEIQKGLDQADAGQLLDGPAVMVELRELIKSRRP